MATSVSQLVDWTAFAETRTQLGGSFIRILGYFREDAATAIAAIEDAMRQRNAAALVSPAHKLKGEARQFGADQLAQLAEDIEMFARSCVEARETPEDYVQHVVQIRPLLDETLAAIDAEANPLMQRQPRFGRRVNYGL